MDQRLIGNDPFPDALLQHITKSAALVIILSPGYLHSEWCRREANAFLDAIREGPYADRRVFVVQTQPTERELWPVEFRDVLGYSFWTQSYDNTPFTLGFPSVDGNDQEYFNLIERLATDLMELMRALAESQPEALRRPPESVDAGLLNLAAEDMAWSEEKRERGEYDVFLCHNAEDKPAVKKIGEMLIGNRVVPWLDE
jgi:hypothetical protein